MFKLSYLPVKTFFTTKIIYWYVHSSVLSICVGLGQIMLSSQKIVNAMCSKPLRGV